MFVCFVDIGGINDYDCLNVLVSILLFTILAVKTCTIYVCNSIIYLVIVFFFASLIISLSSTPHYFC